jgi:hypothetical protein
MTAEQPEALGRTYRVRNGDRCHRELGADPKRQDRSQQASDAKPAYGGNATSEDAGAAEQNRQKAHSVLNMIPVRARQ